MEALHIDKIEDLANLAGIQDMRHPLFHILPVETVNHLPLSFPLDFSFGFYSIGLLRNMKGEIKCGRRSYDFKKGTMFFMSPGQLAGHTLEAMTEADGWLVFFHRSYLAGHNPEKTIDTHGFFDYVVKEALHLSQAEEQTMEQLFVNIYTEFQSPIDKFSRNVVISNLDLLLTYANRFYARQFITRNDVESNFVIEFEDLLKEYFRNHDLEKSGIPSVNYFAEKLNMSAKYLGDKLRTLTGKTAQEHIYLKLTEKAKVLLQEKKHSISEVAFQLGFEYPQYFSRFFKKRVGMSPKVFQTMAN